MWLLRPGFDEQNLPDLDPIALKCVPLPRLIDRGTIQGRDRAECFATLDGVVPRASAFVDLNEASAVTRATRFTPLPSNGPKRCILPGDRRADRVRVARRAGRIAEHEPRVARRCERQRVGDEEEGARRGELHERIDW